VGALAASLFTGAVAPEVQEQASQSCASDPRPSLVFVAVTDVAGVLKIIADIGLFLFRPWARPLFAECLASWLRSS
jgi:hypothetical protein